MKGLFLRDGILFRRGFLPALLLTVLTGLVCFAAAYSIANTARSDKALVSVALVNEDSSMTGNIAINAVKEAPFMKTVLGLEDLDRETALAKFRAGEVEAVIILPEGYIDQIAHGIPGKGYIYLSTSAASAGEIMRAIATFGELMLVTGQQGVFVGEDFLQNDGYPQEIHTKFLTESNVELLERAFTLFGDGCVVEITDYAGSGLPLAESYAVLWLSFFLLLTGLFFVPLYVSDLRKGLLARLYGGGLKPFGFLLGKLVYPFFYRLLLLVPILIAGAVLFKVEVQAGAVLLALLGAVLATLITTCGAVLLSEKKGWPALFAGIFAASLLLSGGIVPRAYLPHFITDISRFLPVGMIYSCLSPFFGGRVDLASILAGSVLAAALLAAALLCLKRFPEKGDNA